MGIYLKYGNDGEIPGDATQEGFKRWINVTDFTWSGCMERKGLRTDTGRARNREPGQPTMLSIQVKKLFDHSSGLLLKALCTVPQAKPCEIAFVRTGEGGEQYLKYTLTDAMLQGVQIQGGADRPTETWTFDFTEVEIEVKQLKEDNTAGDPFRYKYNNATGKSG
jgi:type VI secretion system secreted protein Hcp